GLVDLVDVVVLDVRQHLREQRQLRVEAALLRDGDDSHRERAGNTQCKGSNEQACATGTAFESSDRQPGGLSWLQRQQRTSGLQPPRLPLVIPADRLPP